jgi:osmotically-inducible protein OsmY
MEGPMIPATQLQRNVLAELDWDPSVDAAHIGVTIDDEGVVTLQGTVKTYAEKLAAEKAAKRVMGVKAVANDVQVRLPSETKHTDTELAKAVVHALEWNVRIPRSAIKATVKEGWITLDGQVAWNFEREEAAKAVRRLPGVVGVTNLIVVKPRLKTVDVKEKIEDAFKRSAEIDAAHVKVDVDGAKVTLSGTVRSWQEYEDAANAAWSAAGVGSVENRIVVESGAAVF